MVEKKKETGEKAVKRPPKNDEITHYELGYLLSPLVAADKLAETVEAEVKQWLAEAKAEIGGEMSARPGSLAYAIKKVVEHKGSTFREAYFGAIYFSCRPELLEKLENGLKKSPVVIRSLIIKLSPVIYTLLTRTRPAPVRPEVATGADESAQPAHATPMSTAAIDQEIDQLLV